MKRLTLTLMKGNFVIHRLDPEAELPQAVLNSPFYAATRTQDELSIVLPEAIQIDSKTSDSRWACFRVNGPLDFGLVGILAGIAKALAGAKVSIFAVSTFDTDYIFVKRKQAQAAREALLSANYTVLED
ncbi:MAG: ACT domain-containing protein [Anaerolineae bacterium]|nr:ACT domain-containing protein [Anaerolineae bacterium]